MLSLANVSVLLDSVLHRVGLIDYALVSTDLPQRAVVNVGIVLCLTCICCHKLQLRKWLYVCLVTV